MTTESKITMFIKQNESIFSSLISRGIDFIRVDVSNINDLEQKLAMLVDENNKLKEVVKLNKPAPVPKEVKQVQITQPKKEGSSKEKKDEGENDECDTYEEVKLKFNTITNMEDIKRAFCNKEYDTFETLVQQHPFKYYNVTYKYSSDKDGAPDYSAKNLVRGFVRNLDDYRKYLLAGFRCILVDPVNKIYSYPSMWIVNSTDSIQTILGSMYDDFEFVEITQEQIPKYLKYFRKTNFDEESNIIDKVIIDEVYAH